jgi:hypothetical protein
MDVLKPIETIARYVRALFGRSGRRWDILTKRVRVAITRIIERQWTTDQKPEEPGPWRIIE